MDQWVKIQDIFDVTETVAGGASGWFADELRFSDDRNPHDVRVDLTLKAGYQSVDVIGKTIRGFITDPATSPGGGGFYELAVTISPPAFNRLFLFPGAAAQSQTLTDLPTQIQCDYFNTAFDSVFQLEIFTTPIVAASEFWTDYKGTREIDIS